MRPHLLFVLASVATACTAPPPPDGGTPDPSDPLSIPKFAQPLSIPPPFVPELVTEGNGTILRHEYSISARETVQQVLPPGFPATTVWAYGGAAELPDGTVDVVDGWPGGTIEATRGIPVRVTWINALDGVAHPFPVDPTLHWADPDDVGMPMAPFPAFPPGYPEAQLSVPLVTHLHGAEAPPEDDGNPLAWVTPDGRHGSAYASRVDGLTNAVAFEYPNQQRAATLWYHDHALGITRLNVAMGLAGFYLLRDPLDPHAGELPSGSHEIPLLIQDRSFQSDGSLAFPTIGMNPDVHPYWSSESLGEVVVVNGKAWPNLDVEPSAYRFRLLNGSNARFYELYLEGDDGEPVAFTQIGVDGGYLAEAVSLYQIILAPGERADIVVDFSGHAGRTLRMSNGALAPYPEGDPPDPQTVGQVMRFSVAAGAGVPAALPTSLDTVADLTPDQPPRVLTIWEALGPGGPLGGALNGQRWRAPVSESPRVGGTEDWMLVNLTGDAHPIHLHLVQFQVVGRQSFDVPGYQSAWEVLNGSPAFPVDVDVLPLDPSGFLLSSEMPPEPYERGWKDTAIALPGRVTRLRVRFAPTSAPPLSPGDAAFPFDATSGPGYVWHCHMLDHEDNEMMRPLVLAP